MPSATASSPSTQAFTARASTPPTCWSTAAARRSSTPAPTTRCRGCWRHWTRCASRALRSTGVIPTHVHLDHAGGAGLLMQQLPQARLLVHARGARHMVDPSQLWAGATAVYGPEEMARSYGQLQPVAAEPRADQQRRHADRPRQPHAVAGRHPRPRAPSPLHLGRRRARLVQRRHLRPQLPRIRHRGRRLDHADLDPGAVRTGGAAHVGAAAAGRPGRCRCS